MDYFARQKVGGINLNHWIIKQLPVIRKCDYSDQVRQVILNLTFQLIYKSNSLKKLAVRLNKNLVPTNWSSEIRFNQLAKLICDATTGDQELPEFKDDGKNKAAVSLGRLGGLKGGNARAKALSPEERRNIAKKAAAARWEKK